MSAFGKQDRMINMVMKALEDMGGLYDLQDIFDRIADGRFQSFFVGDSWAITQVIDFPKKRVLHLFLLVGDNKDFQALEHKLEDFAVEQKVHFMRADGRLGWRRKMNDYGWKEVRSVFIKEMV